MFWLDLKTKSSVYEIVFSRMWLHVEWEEKMFLKRLSLIIEPCSYTVTSIIKCTALGSDPEDTEH